jgi:hypothetical protein
MRDFAGSALYPFGYSALEFIARYFSAIIADVFADSIRFMAQRIRVMKRPAKAIAMLASVAVLACSIFVVSWVGLALLGY